MKKKYSKERDRERKEALKFKRDKDHKYLIEVGDPNYMKKRNKN